MNYFEHRHASAQKYILLILLFIGAVFSLVTLAYLLFLVTDLRSGFLTNHNIFEFHQTVFLSTSIVITAITLGSVFRTYSLSRDAISIAEMMEGALLIDSDGDFKRSRLLNLVEEMAVASGTPVPSVFIMHENGINALVLGRSANDAILCVTEGAIQHLNEKELQGVIAHEFCHISNGDLEINHSLIGMLYGILMVSLLGYFVRRAAFRRSSILLTLFVAPVGFALIIAGYPGVFFANLIKRVVCRQREFLTDASVVRFNRIGIAAALKRIGGLDAGAAVDHPRVHEISHALFASPKERHFFTLTSTHPPLAERIKRIDPHWDGKFQFQDSTEVLSGEGTTESDDDLAINADTRAVSPDGGASIDMDKSIEQIGEVRSKNLQFARKLIEQLPVLLKRATREPYGARAVIYFLLLDNNDDIRKQQLDHLNVSADTSVFDELLKLINRKPDPSSQVRLSLIDMSIPALRQLSDAQLENFKHNIDVLVRANKKMGVFEWSLQKILNNKLNSARRHRRTRAKHRSFSSLIEHCNVILSMLVYCDNKPVDTHDQLIKAAGEKLKCEGLRLYKKSELSLQKLDRAVDELRLLKPLLKPRLLKACAAVVTADEIITPSEAELLRAISDSLDCPIPMLI